MVKIADGPVALETSRPDKESMPYTRWRDYHHSYKHGYEVVYVHQLAAIAHGADPYKVFSDGEWEVDHTGLDPALEGVKGAHRVIEMNTEDNLELIEHGRHWDRHVNAIRG